MKKFVPLVIALLIGATTVYASASIAAATYHFGKKIPLAQQTIGPSGGSIVLLNASEALRDTHIEFPPDALEKETTVFVNENEGTLVPNDGLFSGFSLEINVKGVKTLSSPILVTVPYAEHTVPPSYKMQGTPVPYSVTSNGSLRLLQLRTLDRAKQEFSFETFNPGLYVVIWAGPLGSTPPAEHQAEKLTPRSLWDRVLSWLPSRR